MIISKPLTSTIASFTLFTAATAFVVAINIMAITSRVQVAWYNYAIVIVLIPIGLAVFYKVFVNYKVLRFGNNEVEVKYPVLRRKRTYSLADIEWWSESKVKTGKSSEYKELQVKFADGKKISVGLREHTEYGRMVQYLAQKVPKKKAEVA